MMPWTPATLALVTAVIVLAVMLVELRISRANERALRARGAIEPVDDVYVTMAWAYPLAFLAMAFEGALFGPPPGLTTLSGIVIFAAAKGVKYWAILSLGPRWVFRVLVLPGAPLISRGPYAYLRHPNYLGVMGELLGMALIVGSLVTGVIAFLGFAILIRQRIAAEERALGLGDQANLRDV
jgi:methyltransferase